MRRRPGHLDHQHGAARDPRLRRVPHPVAQLPHDRNSDRELPRRGRPTAGREATPEITQGHKKDFRPDLKKLLFLLTVAADGAVPIAYRVPDGNTPDDVTHIPTWDELRALYDHPDFLYVAASKLCSQQALRHIASNGGRFVTIVPQRL